MLTKKNVLICLVLSLQLLHTPCQAINNSTGADHSPATKEPAAKLANDTIWHLGHSAILMKTSDRVLVFDYPYSTRASADQLHLFDLSRIKDEKVYVFASHVHGDHFKRDIFSWKDKVRHVKYILSSDIVRHPDDAQMVAPGQVIQVDDLKVRTYPSTDSGVAFSVYLDNKHIYFAGDNGFWNWQGKKAEEQYTAKDLALVDRTVPMDIAFQVCDPLADGVGHGGIGIFAVTFEPTLLVPIHLRGKYEFLKSIELQLRQRGFKNSFWVVTKPGDSMSFQKTSEKEPESLPKDTVFNSIGMKLKHIPQGEFLMGSSGNEKGQEDDELPQHLVKLTKGFYIGVTEATRAQWAAVMKSRPWSQKPYIKGGYVREGDDYPAVNMNWDEAMEFCKKLSQKEGRTYRLPTEAEWEYACRAGTKTAYSFGDDDTKLSHYGWFRGNAYDVGEKYAHIVAQKKPNPWELYDVHGNVWEWCSDWLGDYPTDAVTDPNGPSTGKNRVIRSGSVSFQAGDARSAERGGTAPGNESCGIGFRIVLDSSAR